ncbi:MAG: hypothetical protein M3O46_03410 [Myxococcota bacterium]|nr:hypothetical protein [Myxococcota bacterium]
MTPAQMDAARGLAFATRKGDVRSPARPALGFILGTTREQDIHRWANRAHLHCDDVRPGFVKCVNVPPETVGRSPSEGSIDELALGFDAQDRLANVTTLREHLDTARASRSSTEIASYLRGLLGPPERQGGGLDPTSLAAPGALGLATVSYRYSDYMAELAAMNLASGCSIREHYISAND